MPSAQAVDHEHALAPLEHEQLDVAVPGTAVAGEMEEEVVGGCERRVHALATIGSPSRGVKLGPRRGIAETTARVLTPGICPA